MKKLQKILPKISGRSGRILTRTKGGRHKRLYRFIDYKRFLIELPAIVKRIEYDPNRTAYIALICYLNGLYSYIIAPQGLEVGMIIHNGGINNFDSGNSLFLKDIPVGTLVNNIELRPGCGGQLVRAAGTYAVVLLKDFKNNIVVIKLKSGKKYNISADCTACIGVVSNIDHKFKYYEKAGRRRWLGCRPIVRGVAKNPVDHPNGGRTSGGKVFKTPWGRIAKGQKTRFGIIKINKYIKVNN